MNTPMQTSPKAGHRFWQTHVKALVEVPVRPLPLRSGATALRLHLYSGRILEIDPDFNDAALDRVLTVLAHQR